MTAAAGSIEPAASRWEVQQQVVYYYYYYYYVSAAAERGGRMLNVNQ